MVIAAITCVICISFSAPWVIGDSNSFLKSFVNHEFLNLLGVVLAITIASGASLHFEFNKIEDGLGFEFLSKTRSGLRASIYTLIVSFCLGVLIAIIKPLIGFSEILVSMTNGAALVVILINVIILTDITSLVFKIKPVSEIKKQIEKDDRETSNSANL